jgi:hypothetical protein
MPQQSISSRLRPQLRPRTPYGGKAREAHIDLDQHALLKRELSAQEVAAAPAQQNQISSSPGAEEIGCFKHDVKLKASKSTTARRQSASATSYRSSRSRRSTRIRSMPPRRFIPVRFMSLIFDQFHRRVL